MRTNEYVPLEDDVLELAVGGSGPPDPPSDPNAAPGWGAAMVDWGANEVFAIVGGGD